jgi:hypothetical protein
MEFILALALIKNSKMVRRQSWPKGHFIFQQVPATIHKDIVPKMQSLPEDVKKEFEKRFDDPTDQIDSIYYSDQIAYVGHSNLIVGYSASSADILASDWEKLI